MFDSRKLGRFGKAICISNRFPWPNLFTGSIPILNSYQDHTGRTSFQWPRVEHLLQTENCPLEISSMHLGFRKWIKAPSEDRFAVTMNRLVTSIEEQVSKKITYLS